MAVKRNKKSTPKSSVNKKQISACKSKSPRRKESLQEIKKITPDTVMDLTSIFLCEDHDFRHITGLKAMELIFLVQALMYINLTEINKEIRQKKKNN